MGTNATQRRAAGSGARCIDVYAADVSRGWRIVRQVTPEFAFRKVNEGKWREQFDEFGNFFGVQVIAAVKTDQELPSGTSATTITARDSMVYAGLAGRSRTMGMSEDRRIGRYSHVTGNALPPEDRIERVIAKVQQWPYPASRIDSGVQSHTSFDRSRIIYGDRAPRVYPRVS